MGRDQRANRRNRLPRGAPALSARFAPGERVEVRLAHPPGHIRTPWYIRGKTGVVERICGEFGNPETLAYGGDGTPHQPLYRVRFKQTEVWPDYEGSKGDTVDLEIFEHWLEPSSKADT